MKKTVETVFYTVRSMLKPDLKMKLTYLMFITCLLQINANSFGQGKKISLNIDNKTVEEAFNHIEALTHFRFLYNVENINLARKISINMVNQKLEKVLYKLFKGTDIEFVLLDQQIILKTSNNITTSGTEPPKKNTSKAIQTQKEISGHIYDKNGLPLVGVTVLLKGTQRGTATDFDGFYKIKASEGDTLMFSFVGFLEVELFVDSDTVFDVTMFPSTFELNEIELYSTGYQTIDKERATGSFERISEEVLELKSNQNILQKIVGEVPGLVVNPNTGEFLLRGQSTFADSNNDPTSPLIVVDGFPLEGGIQTVNPNDIENISVLKDAAAASIWGIRAANGVIVITTKRAKKSQKLQVEVSAVTALTPKPNLFKTPFGSPQTQIDYQRALINRDFDFRQNEVFTGELNRASMRQLNPVTETLILQQRGDISDTEANSRLQELANTDVRNEYSRLILRPERWSQYNVALSGGGEKYNFRSSVVVNQNEAGLKGADSKQIVINLRNGYEITPKLRLTSSANLSLDKTRRGAINTSLIGSEQQPIPGVEAFLNTIPITSRILDSNGNYLPSVIGANDQSSQLALNRGYPYASTYNIMQEFDNANNIERNTSIRLQGALDYNLFDGFSLNLSYQYEQENINLRNLFNENTFLVRQTVNGFTPVNNDGTAGDSPVPLGSILDLNNQNNRFQTFRIQGVYDKIFSEGLHKVNILAGYEVRKTINEGFTDLKYGYDDQSLISIRPDFASNFSTNPLFINDNDLERIPARSSNIFVENRFLSYYANAAYVYNGTYTLSASTRLDDTNLFGASDELRNVPLFSVGIKWNLWNDFFYESNTISDLVLRLTYGTNGNVDRSTSAFLQTITVQNFPPFSNLASNISSLPNPLLRLEKVKTFNLGLDFELFLGNLTGSVEYYRRQSIDVLAERRLNPTVGFSDTLLNSGEILNEGVDVQLSAFLIKNPNFSYRTTGIFSANKNIITKADNLSDNVTSRAFGFSRVQGDAINTLYSIRNAGLDRNGAPQFVNVDGDIIDFRNQVTDVNALINEGTTIPPYYGSWINEFNYKGFFLRSLATFQAGHKFRYDTELTFIPTVENDFVNIPEDFADRWQQPGDENFTDIPAFASLSDTSASGYEDWEFTDKFADVAAVIRLSQLSLGYNLKPKEVKQLGLQSLGLSIQMDNVAVWNFNKWNVDPENMLIPLQPTFTLSISSTF